MFYFLTDLKRNNLKINNENINFIKYENGGPICRRSIQRSILIICLFLFFFMFLFFLYGCSHPSRAYFVRFTLSFISIFFYEFLKQCCYCAFPSFVYFNFFVRVFEALVLLLCVLLWFCLFQLFQL